jgi:hypothetical protein
MSRIEQSCAFSVMTSEFRSFQQTIPEGGSQVKTDTTTPSVLDNNIAMPLVDKHDNIVLAIENESEEIENIATENAHVERPDIRDCGESTMKRGIISSVVRKMDRRGDQPNLHSAANTLGGPLRWINCVLQISEHVRCKHGLIGA